MCKGVFINKKCYCDLELELDFLKVVVGWLRFLIKSVLEEKLRGPIEEKVTDQKMRT